MVNKAEIKEKALTENTAQGVFKHLNDLESNRARMSSRWIWELLQNARDAAAGKTTSLTASVEHQEDELAFLHDGSGFTNDQVAHLIYHGSTKFELEGAIGQFGSGFLSTHLLSSKIDVSGFLNDGQSFEFRLERETGSIQSLVALMDKAWEDFNPSNNPLTVAMPPGFTTRFEYPIGGEAVEAVEQGIATLKQCAPFVVVFNPEFSAVNIKSINGSASFKVMERKPLDQNGTQLVTVVETDNETQRERKYLLAAGGKSTVAFPLESAGSDNVCRSVGNTPRLFLGFPLVGTENFSFPAVINSFGFAPTEHRNGVYLGQGSNQANIDNQGAVEEALALLVRLLGFAAASGWKSVYQLAEIPDIENQDWLNSDWLRGRLKESLIPAIRRIPAVLSESGAIPPGASIVPFTEASAGDAGVKALWDLVNGLTELHQKLPRRNEAAGWRNSVESWAAILRDKVTDFPEVIDGAELAKRVEEKTGDANGNYRHISRLQALLRQEESALSWLNRFCDFLKTNGFDSVLDNRSIVLAQSGLLVKRSDLHRDGGISETLKDIAELLGWKIRDELRDTRITALPEDPGAGVLDDAPVVQKLLGELKKAEQNPDSAFAEASARLFAWIAERGSWELLPGFPVLGRRIEPERPLTVVHLPASDQLESRLMAPVKVWAEDLQPFADLFPPASILADDFFANLPNLNTWQRLAERSLVGTEIIRSSKADDIKFYPDLTLLREEFDHTPVALVPVTDHWRPAGMMNRIRDSQDRARLFWRFLTEWLSPKDLKGLEAEQAECICGEEHRYYPANWLGPLRENSWVRQGNGGHAKATARSLSNLLRGSGWDTNSLTGNPAAVKLLEAMGISRFDLLREFVATTDETRRAVDDAFINMLATAGSNVSHLDQAREYIEDLKVDTTLPTVLAERREQRRRIHENQTLGDLVEKLVKQSLETKGFAVERTGVGSDFAIEYDDVTRLELAKSGKTWLVEVKATRGQGVRITATQAQKAVEKGEGYLVCVVPVEGETADLVLDDVQNSMRFVQNIGPRVEPLCSDLDEFKALRDDITAGSSQGVQLEVEAGAARVRIAGSVWQDDGFKLSELSNRLE